MANDGIPNFQLPPEMRAFAEQSMEQAKKAFDGFVSATQKAVSAMEGQASAATAGVKDIHQKAVANTEKNIAASFAHAQQLLRAKDAQEVMQLHTDYVKAQMQTLTEQARDLGQAAQAASSKATPKV